MLKRMILACIVTGFIAAGCGQKEEAAPAAPQAKAEKYRCDSPEILDFAIETVAGPQGKNLLELVAPEPVGQVETTRRCRGLIRLKKIYYNHAGYTEFANELISTVVNLPPLQSGYDIQYSFTPTANGFSLRADMENGDIARLKRVAEKAGDYKKVLALYKEKEEAAQLASARDQDFSQAGFTPGNLFVRDYRPTERIAFPFAPPAEDTMGRPCSEEMKSDELAAAGITRPTCVIRYFDRIPALVEFNRGELNKGPVLALKVVVLQNKQRGDVSISMDTFGKCSSISVVGTRLQDLPPTLKEELKKTCPQA